MHYMSSQATLSKMDEDLFHDSHLCHRLWLSAIAQYCWVAQFVNKPIAGVQW
jgi:hypothetical protein